MLGGQGPFRNCGALLKEFHNFGFHSMSFICGQNVSGGEGGGGEGGQGSAKSFGTLLQGFVALFSTF